MSWDMFFTVMFQFIIACIVLGVVVFIGAAAITAIREDKKH